MDQLQHFSDGERGRVDLVLGGLAIGHFELLLKFCDFGADSYKRRVVALRRCEFRIPTWSAGGKVAFGALAKTVAELDKRSEQLDAVTLQLAREVA